jgi:hypothetical protein
MTVWSAWTASSVPSASTAALVQDRDLRVERPHEGHVVLDHEDGVVAAQLGDQLGGLLGLGVGHAGHRLVEHDQRGSCISSMPISSHCFWPWLSSPALRSRAGT